MYRGDGNLYFTIYDMGHGDGTIISLPNGKTILIDFGSSRGDARRWKEQGQPKNQLQMKDETVKKLLGDPRYLLNYKTLDVVILTHSDGDHHNYISKLFQDGKLTARKVFFSGQYSEYFKGTRRYGVTNDCLMKMGKSIYSITINSFASSYKKIKGYSKGKWEFDPEVEITQRPRDEIHKSTENITEGFVKILDGTDHVPCGFYLLASNVDVPFGPGDADGSSPQNRGSIVSMIVYGAGGGVKKFLFLGDATIITETFLMKTYGNRIDDVELVQVGHHASLTSSSRSFVERINPRKVVVSACYEEKRHRLPRLEVLRLFETIGKRRNLQTRTDSGNIFCYGPAQSPAKRPADSDEPEERPNKRFRAADGSAEPRTTAGNTAEVNADPGPIERTLFRTSHAIWCTGSDGPVDYAEHGPSLTLPVPGEH